MSAKNSDEPSLENIEDYEGKESQNKKNTIRLVIIGILIVGFLFAYLKNSSYEEAKKDYLGTENKPGITNIKK